MWRRLRRAFAVAKRKANKSDRLLGSVTELQGEVLWKEFEFKTRFKKVCGLQPIEQDANTRKLVIVEAVSEAAIARPSCVYVLVIDGRIFKIGQTTVGLVGRVSSYNCGQVRNRRRGTCSVTNYWALQSICNMGQVVDVYCFYPDEYPYEMFGAHGREAFPSAKKHEKRLLSLFVARYGKKPIGCSQG